MYASIRVYRAQRQKLSELNKIVNEEFVPLVSKLPGYVAYFGINQGDGKWASVSVFDSEDAAKASNKTAAEFVRTRLTGFFESGPEVTTGSIAASGFSTRGAAGLEQARQTH